MNYSQEKFPQSAGLMNLKRHLIMLGCTLVLLALASVVGYGQDPHNPKAELEGGNAQFRAFAPQEMNEASEDFGLTLQLNNLGIFSRNDVFGVTSNVVGVTQLTLQSFENGNDVDFIFLSSHSTHPFVPNGFYIVRAYVNGKGHGGNDDDDNDRGKNDKDQKPGKPRVGHVDLLNQARVVVATVPLVLTPGNANPANTSVIHTFGLGVSTLTLDTHWNSGTNSSINLTYTLPLER
jgi:hypothetical protein